MKKYIYIVQVTRQLSIDIVNRMAFHSNPIMLITGSVEEQYESLHPSVKTIRLNRYRNQNIFGRIISGLLFFIRSFFYVLFHGRQTELILVSTPPFLPFLGSVFYWLRKQKFHLLIWDLYPDVLVQMNKISHRSWLFQYWKRINRRLFSQSASILTLGKKMAEAIAASGGQRIHVIPPWSHASYFQPVVNGSNPFIKIHGLQNKFIVMYAGNLGITHPVEVILSLAESMRANDHFLFIIMGDGEKKKLLIRKKEKAGLTSVLLLPPQSSDMFPYALQAAHVSIITLSASASYVSLPSKTFSALAAGTALMGIGNPDSELGSLIQHYNCGQIFHENDIKSMQTFLNRLYHEPELLNRYRQAARQAAADFTPENASRYVSVITSS
jgi:glycosyltransferase involved in cell wall biosynthesis